MIRAAGGLALDGLDPSFFMIVPYARPAPVGDGPAVWVGYVGRQQPPGRRLFARGCFTFFTAIAETAVPLGQRPGVFTFKRPFIVHCVSLATDHGAALRTSCLFRLRL